MGISFPRYSSTLCARIYYVISLIALFSVAAHCQITFRKPDFDVGRMPVAVAAADFNRDGHLDIVTANAQDNTVSVLLNDGVGGFLQRKDFFVEGNPRAVGTGDFNKDGFPDIAVANHDTGTISILLGDGNGGFRGLPFVAAGRSPSALVAGDFNRDGKLDMAVLNQADATVGVYFGNGDGSFAHNADYPTVPDAGFSAGMAAADFNNDGILDLAVVNGAATASIYRGKADGSFVFTSSLSVPSLAITGPIAVADFNQDGKPDLLVQGQTCDRGGCFGPILVFAGNGDGTFDQGHNLFLPDSAVPLAVTDLNGDGVPDVVTEYSVMLVNPSTIFSTSTKFQRMFPGGLGEAAMVAGDFDGDGKPDVVTANSGDNTVSLLRGNGDGTFHQPLRYVAGINPQAIATGDFNGDGKPDIAIASEIVLGIQIFSGNGDGSLKPPVKIATDMDVFEVAVADLNHDGIPDLIATGEINNGIVIRVLPGRSDGSFGPPIDRPGLVSIFGGLAMADFNGDGFPDVATIGGSFTASGMFLHIYFNNGDGSLRDPVDTPLGFQAGGIAVGDFNHDGKPDVVVGRNNNFIIGNIAVLLGNGDGTFQNSANFTAGGSLAVGDFNHDGIQDFVALPDLFLGNGDGTFRQFKGTLTVNGLFNQGGFPHIADMDGDGLPDIVVAQSDRLTVFLNNGNGTFKPPAVFNTGGAWDLVLADFDSDGLPDIATTGAGLNETVALLLNNGSGTPQTRDFRLALNTQSIAVMAGQSGNGTISVTALGTFQGQLTFSCGGLPALATCNFSPPSVALSGGATISSTLTITTSAATTAGVVHGLNGLTTLALSLPILGLVFAGVTGRKNHKLWLIAASSMFCVLLFAGCSGLGANAVHKSGTGTPPGAYTITVSATSSGSAPITHSQTFVLKVQ
jgi:hypothetical protein